MSTTLSPPAPTAVGRPHLAPKPLIAETIAPQRDGVFVARCRWLFRLVAVTLCGLHAYVARHAINPDGISYLDVATAYQRGDVAVNAYWSPLYSWLLAGVLALFRPSPYWESAVVHAVNFVIFLLALAAFEWLLSELLHSRRVAGEAARDQEMVPDWFVVGFAYAVFVFVSRCLVTVSYVTPDMMVAGLVYAVAALTLRTRRLGPTPTRSLLLGTLLGVGYLAKAVLFPLGLVFLATSLIATGSLRRAALHLVWSVVAFAVLAAPFMTALSLKAGRPTFGDSGRLNYLWYVAGRPSPHDAAPRAELPASGVRTFARPGGGSYPLWYDPGHWCDTQTPPFDVRAQAAALFEPARLYVELLFGRMLCYTGALALLFGYTFFSRRESLRAWIGGHVPPLAGQYVLLVPALAGLGLYLLVGHAEGRLIGPFLVLALTALAECLRFRQSRLGRVWLLCLILLAVVSMPSAALLAYDVRNAVVQVRQGESTTANPAAAVAADLEEHGLQAGDPVASIGFTYDAYWARLGGWQVVAEVPQGSAAAFWSANADDQAATLDAFRRTGARVVVCENVPPHVIPGWRRVAGTKYAVYDLRGDPKRLD